MGNATFFVWRCDMDDAVWATLKSNVPIGSSVTGRVMAQQPYGVFLDVGLGFPGLLELIEFSDADDKRDRDWFPPIGETLTARVLQFMEHNRQIRLTQRERSEDIWDDIRERLAALANEPSKD